MVLKRFFLYGYYGFNNFGDDLILRAIVAGIQKYIPNAEFVVRSLWNGPDLGEIVKYSHIDEIINDTSHGKVYRLIAYLWKYINICWNIDGIVIGGGTLIHDKKSQSSLIILLLIIVIAKIFRKKVFCIGLGISDLKRPYSLFILKILALLSDTFFVRDFSAENILLQAKVSKNQFNVTADVVYSLVKKTLPRRGKIDLKEKYIGITLADKAVDKEILKVHFKKYVINLLKDKIYKYKILWIPFHVMGDKLTQGIDDASLMQEIQIELKIEGYQTELITDINVCFEEVYSKLDFVMGMRFHSLVLAAIYNVPFAGIIHDNKMSCICTGYNMPLIQAKDISSSLLLEIHKKGIVLSVNEQVNEYLLKEAIKNFDCFREGLL